MHIILYNDIFLIKKNIKLYYIILYYMTGSWMDQFDDGKSANASCLATHGP